MQPGGRLSAAIEVLEEIEARYRPARNVLRDWGVSHRFAGSSDRAVIGNIVYDALRCRRSSSWILDDPSPRSVALGTLMNEWNMPPCTLAQLLSQDKFSPLPLKENEIALAKKRLLEPMPDHVTANCPDWCIPLLKKTFGEQWVQESHALSRRPPLDLRVNTLLANREEVLKELQEMNAVASSLSPHAIRIPAREKGGRPFDVSAEPFFQRGFFEIQDEGSQIVAQLLEAKPDMQVLDFCAGGGGKTLALAAMMKNKGHIFVHDSSKARLAPLFERLKRAEVTNVSLALKSSELDLLKKKMDVVLIDVPCTGSGVWRRRPDAKWRLTLQRVQECVKQQELLLDTACHFVKPGGRLIYVTCSILEEENGNTISSFMQRNTAFAPVDHIALWNRNFPASPNLRYSRTKKENISLSPFISGTDGFFFCALEPRID